MKRETFVNLAHFGFGIIAGMGILGCLVISWSNNNKDLDAYRNYYNATEAYIDELDEMVDTATGSDTHCYYLDCRAIVDSLNK